MQACRKNGVNALRRTGLIHQRELQSSVSFYSILFVSKTFRVVNYQGFYKTSIPIWWLCFFYSWYRLENAVNSKEDFEQKKSGSVIAELGLTIQRNGEELISEATVYDGMLIPGTDILRLSVVAAWADTILGVLALKSILPNVPATVSLDVHLIKPIRGKQLIHSRSKAIKIGRTVSEYLIEFHDESGEALGYGHGLFMATPNPQYQLPAGDDWVFKGFAELRPGLTMPISERISCEQVAPGAASLPCSADIHNATKAINGGILAVAIEDAVLSAMSAEQSLSSMMISYQRSIRGGPAIAKAQLSGNLARVEVVDADKDALAALASVQLFPN